MYLFTVWGNLGDMRTLMVISSQQVNYFHILSALPSVLGTLWGSYLGSLSSVSFSLMEGREPKTLEKNSMPVCQLGDAHTPGATGWLRAPEVGQSLVHGQDILTLAPNSSSRGAGFTHSLAASLSLGLNPGPG